VHYNSVFKNKQHDLHNNKLKLHNTAIECVHILHINLLFLFVTLLFYNADYVEL